MRPRFLVLVMSLMTAGTLAACSANSTAIPANTSATTSGVVTTTAPPSWASMFTDVNDGVGRISVITCDGSGTGSGFLVKDDEVMTAAHVVRDTASISVRLGTDVRAAEVIGIDSKRDLALIKLSKAVPGHVFDIAEQKAGVGEDVAAIGFPYGQPIAMTRGAVTAVDRRVEVEGKDLRNLMQTDTALNPGNSGGPVVTIDGDIVGVVSAGAQYAAGFGWAVQQPQIAAAFDRWQGDDPVETDSDCPVDASVDRGVVVKVTTSSTSPEAPTVAQQFQLYADAINTGRYDIAWDLLTPTAKGRQHSYGAFEEALSSSYWLSFDVRSVKAVDPNTDEAVLRFRTVQAASKGPRGQTCSDWEIRYRLSLDSGTWKIDKATSQAAPKACSETLPG